MNEGAPLRRSGRRRAIEKAPGSIEVAKAGGGAHITMSSDAVMVLLQSGELKVTLLARETVEGLHDALGVFLERRGSRDV